MALSRVQIDQFQAEGYVIARHFFDEREVYTMRAELERLVNEGKLRNVSTAGDGATHSTTNVNLQICPLSPHSDVFRSLPFSPKVRDAVRALIGDDFVLHLDQIFLKPARQGAGTGWHQDNAYFHIPDPKQGTGMWVALHDASVANGTMHIVPGSFTKQFEHDRDMSSDHHIHCEVDEETETVLPVEIDAGGVLFFNYGTAHCTKGNHTDADRAGLALHFLRADHRESISGFGDCNPYLAGPSYSRGEKEYGENMEGRWEKHTAAMGSSV